MMKEWSDARWVDCVAARGIEHEFRSKLNFIDTRALSTLHGQPERGEGVPRGPSNAVLVQKIIHSEEARLTTSSLSVSVSPAPTTPGAVVMDRTRSAASARPFPFPNSRSRNICAKVCSSTCSRGWPRSRERYATASSPEEHVSVSSSSVSTRIFAFPDLKRSRLRGCDCRAEDEGLRELEWDCG